MGYGTRLLIGLLLWASGVPSPSLAQEAAPEHRVWFDVGLGGALFDGSVDLMNSGELALQIGSTLLALHVATTVETVSLDQSREVGFLLGRGSTGPGLHWAYAAGVSVVSMGHRCGTGGGAPECPVGSTMGLPAMGVISYPFSRYSWIGVKAFGNLNDQKSFLGLGLALRFGTGFWVPAPANLP